MNLRKARIGKECATLVRTPRCRNMPAFRIGRGSRRYYNRPYTAARITHMRFNLARLHVAYDNATCIAINHDQIQHFVARVHLHRARTDLTRQCLVSPQKQLLPGLTTRVKSARYLRATKGAIVQHAAILPRKGHTLRHAFWSIMLLLTSAKRSTFGLA